MRSYTYPFILLVLLFSCTAQSPIATSSLFDLIILTLDKSGTRTGVEQPDSIFITQLLHNLESFNRNIVVRLDRVGHKYPQPCECRFQKRTTTTKFAGDFKKISKRNEVIQAENEAQKIQFMSCFITKFSNVSTKGRGKSYVKRHIKQFTHALTDTSLYNRRIGFFSSDFIDDEGKKQMVSEFATQIFNECIEAGADIFVESFNPSVDDQFRIASYRDMRLILETLFTSHQKL